MKVFKSDGRYRLHDKGLTHICEFNWHSENRLHAKLLIVFTQMFGPQKEEMRHESGRSYWKYNDNYRFETNRSAKRRRINLKDETSITMAMLQVEN